MEQNLAHTLGLKIKPLTADPKVLYCVKKLTGISLMAIKDKVAKNDYLLLVDACELEDIRKINTLKRELSDIGVEVVLYRDDEVKTSEYFDNIENRAREIAQESDF